MYKDFIKSFKSTPAVLTHNPLVIADRPPIPYGTNEDIYVYDASQLTFLPTGVPVDAALELRGQGGLLLPRMTYAEMKQLTAVPGMVVFVIDQQGATQPTIYMSTSIDPFTYESEWTPLFGNYENIIIKDDTKTGSLLKYEGINTVGQKVLSEAQALVPSQFLAKDGENALEVLSVQFTSHPSDLYSYVHMDNISEVNFADYAKLSINAVDNSRVPHAFLEAFVNTKDFSGTKHQQITTVISGGNSDPIQPTTMAATLELTPSDSPIAPFAGLLNGRMSQATIDLMMFAFIGDDLRGMSWFNQDANRHQFAFDKDGFNTYSTLIPMQDNKTTNSMSIGEKAFFAPDVKSAIAIGDNALAGADNGIAIGANTKANGVNSVAIGKDASTNVDNHIVLGVDSFVSIHDSSPPSASLSIGGGLYPHIGITPLSSQPIFKGNVDYFYSDNSREFFLKSTDSTGSLQISVLNVDNIKTNKVILKSDIFATSLQSSSSLSEDLSLTLPSGKGLPGQRLSSDGIGNMYWGDDASDIPIVGTTSQITVTSDTVQKKIGIEDNPVIPGLLGMTLPGGAKATVEAAEQASGMPIPAGTIRFISI